MSLMDWFCRYLLGFGLFLAMALGIAVIFAAAIMIGNT
jgi:hypothetical protein